MNRKVISLLLLAIMFLSPFAFASDASVVESGEVEGEGWIVTRLEELGSWITGLSIGGLGSITGKITLEQAEAASEAANREMGEAFAAWMLVESNPVSGPIAKEKYNEAGAKSRAAAIALSLARREAGLDGTVKEEVIIVEKLVINPEGEMVRTVEIDGVPDTIVATTSILTSGGESLVEDLEDVIPPVFQSRGISYSYDETTSQSEDLAVTTAEPKDVTFTYDGKEYTATGDNELTRGDLVFTREDGVWSWEGVHTDGTITKDSEGDDYAEFMNKATGYTSNYYDNRIAGTVSEDTVADIFEKLDVTSTELSKLGILITTDPEEVTEAIKSSDPVGAVEELIDNTPSSTESEIPGSSLATEGQKEEVKDEIMSILTEDVATGPQVLTYEGEDYLVTSGIAKTGETVELVNLVDGDFAKITLGEDDFSIRDATDLQSAYSKVAVDLDSGETTLANILGSASLAKELAGDKDALKALGLEKVKVDGDVIKATALDGSTVSVKGGKIIDQTAALREGSSEISQMMGLVGGTGLDALVSGATWAGLAFGAGQVAGAFLGLDTRNTNALSAAFAAASGTFRGLSVWDATAGFTTGANLAIAGAVGIGVFLATYRDEQTDVVEFECMPWQAPSGGDDCELCNEGDLPCSEYRCRSLGQNCEIVNSGTEEEKCVAVRHDDVDPPIITPNEAMLTLEYDYANVKNSPPGPGFEIVSENADGCLKAFSPLAFGISINEPAQCKIDFSHTTTFDEMKSYMGDNNLYLYNHSEKFSLPSVAILEESSVTLENGKDLTFFIRCKDKSGNENSAEYAVRFCVDPTPDSTAPRVEASSIMNGGCVAEGEENAEVEFYTNEPADCRWSGYDQNYESMQNEMVRAGTAQINSLQLFSHVANLEGISREDTEFYVRCKDLPDADDSDRNEMRESFKFSLRGSSGLKTRNLGPSETVFGGISPMPIELHVETILGCNNGEAVCSYSSTYDENGEDYIIFFETSTTDGIHNQRLDLTDGEHEYFVRCIDEGGNLVEDVVKFELDINTDGPTIARVYEEAQMLKVVTTRESECSYSLDNCDFSFEEGTMMPYANSIVHLAEWDEKRTFYIKCRDEFRDAGTDCSVIVRPMKNFL